MLYKNGMREGPEYLLGGGCSGPFILGSFWHAMRETGVFMSVAR